RTAAPPLLSVDPHSFLLGVKVVDEEKRLGLPGLVVRVTNPRHKHCLLAEGMTDLDGNVVLAFTNEQVHDLAREKVEPTIEILAPPDTLLHRTARIACPRLGGAETWVASLHASAELEPHITAAQQASVEREARLVSLNTRLDRLQAEHTAM